MDTAHIVVILLGAILPVVGAYLAYRNVRASLRKHDRDVELATTIRNEWNEATREAAASTPPQQLGEVSAALTAKFHKRFTEAGLLVPSWDTANANATGDLAVGRTLRLLAKGNGWNVSIVVVGIAASTVASIWSLFISAT
jgi:hypothetical protein